MKLFGFTIISTKELKRERAKNLQAIKELNEKVEKDYEELKKRGEELKKKGEKLDAFIQKQASVFFEQNEKQRDIELRKWSLEHSSYKSLNECAEFIYRYVKHGDTSAIEDYDEFRNWRMKKEDAKASQSHPEAHLQ